MNFNAKVLRLSNKFYIDYPKSRYPELLEKEARAYACLLVDCHDYFVCIPYRTNILHKNAYHFKHSKRSANNNSGLDYSKIAITNNSQHIENIPAVIDKDEYNETMININKIVYDAVDYVETYIKHISGEKILHPREYIRKYRYSTLPYFEEILVPHSTPVCV